VIEAVATESIGRCVFLGGCGFAVAGGYSNCCGPTVAESMHSPLNILNTLRVLGFADASPIWF